MEELIIVQIKPTELEHTVYIMTNSSETVPIVVKCTQETLFSTVVMSASKYNISNIKIQGPHTYTQGIKDQLQAKVNTCFGNNNNIAITLI